MTRINFFIVLLVLIVLFVHVNSSTSISETSNGSWNNYYVKKNPYFNFRGMSIDNNDSIILIGDVAGNNLPGNHSTSFSSTDFNGGIVKLDSHGSFLWSAYFGGNSSDNFNKAVIDSNNNIIVFGTAHSTNLPKGTYNYTLGPQPSYYYTNFLIKYSPTGKVLWITYFRDTVLPYTEDVTLCSNNSIILTLGNYRSVGTTVFNSQGQLVSGLSTYQYFSTFFYDAFSTANHDIYKLGSTGSGFTYPVTSYVLTKYDGNFSKIWSVDLYQVIPKIYSYQIQLTNNNSVLFYGSFDNSNTSDINSENYNPDLSQFYVLIDNNGTIAWTKKLILTGENYLQSFVYNNVFNESLIIGQTYSSNYPVYNSNSSKYNGNGDLTLIFLNNQGTFLQRCLLGSSGYDSALDVRKNSKGLFIIAARSRGSSLHNSELIIFAVDAQGIVLESINFESTPGINQISNLGIYVVGAIILFFGITVFNAYTSGVSSSKDGISKPKLVGKKTHKITNPMSMVHCPNDGTRMQPFVSRSNPSAEFLISKGRIDVGLSNAVAMKKILPYSVENIKNLTLNIFERYADLEDVTLRAMQCPICHFVSATPISLPVEWMNEPEKQIDSETKDIQSEMGYLSSSPSLLSYINPFPSMDVIKRYFRGIVTFNKNEMSEFVTNPEVTKMTTLAIIVNSLFPFQFNGGQLLSFGIALNIVLYFLIFLLSSYIYTGLVKTKDVGFSALDNFRLWGVILWINVPILLVFYGFQYVLHPSFVVGSFSVSTSLDLVRVLLLLVLYSVLLSKLTKINQFVNIFATIVVFVIVSYAIVILMILGFLAMLFLGFLGMFGILIIFFFLARSKKTY